MLMQHEPRFLCLLLVKANRAITPCRRHAKGTSYEVPRLIADLEQIAPLVRLLRMPNVSSPLRRSEHPRSIRRKRRRQKRCVMSLITCDLLPVRRVEHPRRAITTRGDQPRPTWIER